MTSRRFHTTIHLGCALVLASSAARAQPSRHAPGKHAGPPSLAQSLTGDAKEAYSAAELLFNNGDLLGAERKYRQAYDLSKDPRLLFNMAIAEKGLHAYARMREHLEQFKHEEGAAITADDKQAVDAALAAIRNLIGTVTITVDVPGAVITLDDQPVGHAPLDGPLTVDLGDHTIGVESPDFDPVKKAVTIEGGASASLDITLVRTVHSGQLVVVAEPDGATIDVDGAAVYKGRFDGPLTAESHQVRVTAPGRVPYSANVELRERETRTLQVSLVAEGHAALWPWIVGGVAVAAGAAVGGYFLFKPHDQTVDVPPGSIGSVQLSLGRN